MIKGWLLDDITLDEISNQKKRKDFYRDNNNWILVDQILRYSFRQLRGTSILKIDGPYWSKWTDTTTITIATLRYRLVKTNGSVGWHIDSQYVDYEEELKKVAQRLRSELK